MSAEDFSMFKERRRQQRDKRASNRENSPQLLKSKGIPHSVHNDGAHIKIPAGSGHIDFWPGTGLWIDRVSGKTDRGVFKLVAYYDRIIGVSVTSSGLPPASAPIFEENSYE